MCFRRWLTAFGFLSPFVSFSRLTVFFFMPYFGVQFSWQAERAFRERERGTSCLTLSAGGVVVLKPPTSRQLRSEGGDS